MRALGVLPIGNFLTGRLQRSQRAGHAAAEQHCRTAAQYQQRRRGRQPHPQLGVTGGEHRAHIVGAEHIGPHAGQIQRLGQQQIPPPGRPGQLPGVFAVRQGLLQRGARQSRRQAGVKRICTVQPECHAAARIGCLLGILLGSGRQNVIFKLRAVRSLKDDAFQRILFLFLLGLQGRAGAGQTAGKALPGQQQPCRAQRAGQQRNAAQR